MTCSALLDMMPVVVAAGDTASGGSHGAEAARTLPGQGEMLPVLLFMVTAGVYVLCVGMALCLWRLIRGPELADRVLAADLLALHVVGLVVLLTIYVGDLVFFDAALVVSIIGFVSTVGFSQYIYATAKRKPGEARTDLDLEPQGDPA
ncbi:MAG: monovalent cation/H+ antiporter complex subunit F [Planctomycetota bacterium]